MASSSGIRGSNRIIDEEKQSVLDEATRNRRLRQALEALEADNSHEDPHGDLVMHKKAPKFEELFKKSERKKKKVKKTKSAEYFKVKYNKPLHKLLEMDLEQNPEAPNYASAVVGPSQLPQRHFCAVCGVFAKYTCVSCGARFCSLQCLPTHKETRCLKWTG